MNLDLKNYTLFLADNALILGQRLGEWCGHGPVLEQDIALTNISLDHLGQSRMLLQYAAKQVGNGATEDSLAFFRNEGEFRNLLITELPNNDWAYTLAKHFLFDTFNFFQYEFLMNSKDETIQAIARKAIKEIAYHAQFSAEWIIRMGDGTEESHQRVQNAIDELWMYTGELFVADSSSEAMTKAAVAPDYALLKEQWQEKVSQVLEIATLVKPEEGWMQKGGREGKHTEHMGYILAEMQHLPRTYPTAKW